MARLSGKERSKRQQRIRGFSKKNPRPQNKGNVEKYNKELAAWKAARKSAAVGVGVAPVIKSTYQKRKKSEVLKLKDLGKRFSKPTSGGRKAKFGSIALGLASIPGSKGKKTKGEKIKGQKVGKRNGTGSTDTKKDKLKVTSTRPKPGSAGSRIQQKLKDGGHTQEGLDKLTDKHAAWVKAKKEGTLGDWEKTYHPDRTPQYTNKKKKDTPKTNKSSNKVEKKPQFAKGKASWYKAPEKKKQKKQLGPFKGSYNL